MQRTGGLPFCVIFLFLFNDLRSKRVGAEFLFSILRTSECVSPFRRLRTVRTRLQVPPSGAGRREGSGRSRLAEPVPGARLPGFGGGPRLVTNSQIFPIIPYFLETALAFQELALLSVYRPGGLESQPGPRRDVHRRIRGTQPKCSVMTGKEIRKRKEGFYASIRLLNLSYPPVKSSLPHSQGKSGGGGASRTLPACPHRRVHRLGPTLPCVDLGTAELIS